METTVLNSTAGMLVLNVVAASLLLGTIAVMLMVVARRTSLSIQHTLLLIAVIVLSFSPLPIWFASQHGVGLVTVSSHGSGGNAARSTRSSTMNDAAIVSQHRLMLADGRIDAGSIKPADEIKIKLDDPLAAKPPRSAGPVVRGSPKWWTFSFLIDAISMGLLAVWLVVSTVLSVRFLWGLRWLRQLQQSIRPASDCRPLEALRRVIGKNADSMIICESDHAPAPLILGWWKPVIVLPTRLASSLNDDELASVLAHEAAHALRHDTIVALLQHLSSILYWWNPCLSVISRRIKGLREQLCDDLVIERLGDSLPLAHALLKVAEWSVNRTVAVPFVSTLFEDDDDLVQRMTRLTSTEHRTSSGIGWISRVLLGLIGILFVSIPLCPVLRMPMTVAVVAADDHRASDEWKVQVLVVDPKGNPIPQPRVGVAFSSDWKATWSDGDQSGKVSLTFPTRSIPYCYLLARAKGYAPMRAFWRNGKDFAPDPLPEQFTFQMTKSITVGGEVRDEDNEPVPGATVRFSAGDDTNRRAERAENGFFQEEYQTDDQGRWQCDLAPETISTASMMVSHPSYAVNPHNWGQDHKLEELRSRTHQFKLKKGFFLAGTVTDTDGDPIAGATLVVSELNVASDDGPFVVTDESGHFRTGRIAPMYEHNDRDPNSFAITAIKQGLAATFESIPGFGGRPLDDSDRERRILNMVLPQGTPLTLKIVDSQDQPISGAGVVLTDWHGTNVLLILRKFGIPAKTDEQGIWKWEHAPVDLSFNYDVYHQGFTSVRRQSVELADEQLMKTVVLKRPQVIRGTVIDAKTQKPIDEFVVKQAFENVKGAQMSNRDGLFWNGNFDTRGKNGTYSVAITEPTAANYTYRVVATGYEPSNCQSIPFREGETEVNFELRRVAGRKEAEEEFGKIYFLDKGEVLKHIPCPLDEVLRRRWYNAIFPTAEDNESMVDVCLYLEWRDGKASWYAGVSGTANTKTTDGIELRNIFDAIRVIPRQNVEGDVSLVSRRVAGDWVFDPKADPDKLVAGVEAVLRKEWGIPVKLRLQDVERDVYVASGEWNFKPISADFPGVQIYGSYLNKNSGGGGASGTIDDFLKSVGTWIEHPVINEVKNRPKEISWRFHMISPFKETDWANAHNPETVTANLKAQTNIEFTVDRRRVRILSVEQEK